MHDEAAFLARIRETPDDVAPRLVFADWLDEHDDPRGELIRLTEEMRTLAPYSDAYWALKPRRKALREGVADEWLEAMRYNDVWPIFTHGWPYGWRERWRLIREYVERWYHLEMPDIGELAMTAVIHERQIRRPLPPSVREWYAFVGDVGSIDGFHQLQTLETGSIAMEIPGVILHKGEDNNEGMYDVVMSKNFDSVDPPVYRFHWSQVSTLSQSKSAPYVFSLSLYGLRIVLRQQMVHDVDRSSSYFNLSKLYGELREAFPCQFAIDGLRIFEKRNIQVQLSDSPAPNEVYMRVRLARPVSRSELPPIIRNGVAPAMLLD